MLHVDGAAIRVDNLLLAYKKHIYICTVLTCKTVRERSPHSMSFTFRDRRVPCMKLTKYFVL